MKLLVYLRDGRTVYCLTGRQQLSILVGLEPWHEEKSVISVRGIWNPTTGRYTWLPGVRLRSIAKGSISVVEECHPADAPPPEMVGKVNTGATAAPVVNLPP